VVVIVILLFGEVEGRKARLGFAWQLVGLAKQTSDEPQVVFGVPTISADTNHAAARIGFEGCKFRIGKKSCSLARVPVSESLAKRCL